MLFWETVSQSVVCFFILVTVFYKTVFKLNKIQPSNFNYFIFCMDHRPFGIVSKNSSPSLRSHICYPMFSSSFTFSLMIHFDFTSVIGIRSMSIFLDIYPAWCSLTFQNAWFVSVINFGKFSAIITSIIHLLCSFFFW